MSFISKLQQLTSKWFYTKEEIDELLANISNGEQEQTSVETRTVYMNILTTASDMGMTEEDLDTALENAPVFLYSVSTDESYEGTYDSENNRYIINNIPDGTYYLGSSQIIIYCTIIDNTAQRVDFLIDSNHTSFEIDIFSFVNIEDYTVGNTGGEDSGDDQK